MAPNNLEEQLVKYLTDAHAIEEQSLKVLEKGPKLAGVPVLASIYEHELLLRVAQRAGSTEVQALAGHIRGEERAAAEKIWNLLGDALDASLQEQGLATA